MSKNARTAVGLGMTALAIFGGYTLYKRWRRKS